MDQFNAKLNAFFRRKSVKYAIPFMFVVVGGSFGLKEFAKLRWPYEFSTVNTVRDEAKKAGLQMKKPSETTLEKEYEKLKDLDIDNWVQVRGPRPWEEKDEE